MKPSTLIIWLLVAAFLAIDFAMMGELQIRRNEWPEAGGIFGLGLVFAQISLLALWFVFGHSNIAFRTITSMIGLFVVSFLASYSTNGGPAETSFWFAFALCFTATTTALLSVARAIGLEIRDAASYGDQQGKSRTLSKQFTIWGLLSLMTGVGAVLGAIRFADMPEHSVLAIGAFGLVLASLSCSVLLTAIAVRRWWITVLVVITSCPAAGALLQLTGIPPDDGPLPIILSLYAQCILTMLAAHVVRQSGYVLQSACDALQTTASKSSVASVLESEDQVDEP